MDLLEKYLFSKSQLNKRKYSSDKDTIGKIAPNLIHRGFFAVRQNMKWYTDSTEFHLNGQKLYLSPILDGCGGDIASHSISHHPDMNLVMSMPNKAFAKHKALNACIFHTSISKQSLSMRSEALWHYTEHVVQR